jgi:hypothetical protein
VGGKPEKGNGLGFLLSLYLEDEISSAKFNHCSKNSRRILSYIIHFVEFVGSKSYIHDKPRYPTNTVFHLQTNAAPRTSVVAIVKARKANRLSREGSVWV